MGRLGPSDRKGEPLRVFAMALALAVAAFAGAVIGFAIDFAAEENTPAAQQDDSVLQR